ncbi:MAG: Gfo/Idh/MocA family oxidoreductase [Planctomycetes bacterium]|nr:Gfo/Idh/MocA family oxidoreductase [Planctomycetota bacterium]
MFRCAFLGCGGRARGHAHAYKHVRRGRLVALCDMNAERLQKFGDDFGISVRYTRFEEMLEKEKPDLLHIVTPPTIRYSLLKIASEYRVPAVIIEKPIAIQGEDWRDIQGLAKSTGSRIAVNTQLHFHPRNLELKKLVASGAIGEVRFIDASARSTPVNQGPHVLQLVSSYVNFARPMKVFGQVSGVEHLNSGEPSPAHATASVLYANGVRAQVTFGTEGAPKSNPHESVYMHKRVAAYGSRGFVHWHMAGWECYTAARGLEQGVHEYGAEDVLGQAGLTEAMFDWLEDDRRIHPTNLSQSLAEFNLLLGMYVSSLRRLPVELPLDPPDGLIEALKKALA